MFSDSHRKTVAKNRLPTKLLRFGVHTVQQLRWIDCELKYLRFRVRSVYRFRRIDCQRIILEFALYNSSDNVLIKTFVLGFAPYNGSDESSYVAVPYQTNYHKTDIKDTLDLYTPFGMWCESLCACVYCVRVCMCHVHVCVHHPVWDVCICLCMCVCLTDMYTYFEYWDLQLHICMCKHVCVCLYAWTRVCTWPLSVRAGHVRACVRVCVCVCDRKTTFYCICSYNSGKSRRSECCRKSNGCLCVHNQCEGVHNAGQDR